MKLTQTEETKRLSPLPDASNVGVSEPDIGMCANTSLLVCPGTEHATLPRASFAREGIAKSKAH